MVLSRWCRNNLSSHATPKLKKVLLHKAKGVNKKCVTPSAVEPRRWTDDTVCTWIMRIHY